MLIKRVFVCLIAAVLLAVVTRLPLPAITGLAVAALAVLRAGVEISTGSPSRRRAATKRVTVVLLFALLLTIGSLVDGSGPWNGHVADPAQARAAMFSIFICCFTVLVAPIVIWLGCLYPAPVRRRRAKAGRSTLKDLARCDRRQAHIA